MNRKPPGTQNWAKFAWLLRLVHRNVPSWKSKLLWFSTTATFLSARWSHFGQNTAAFPSFIEQRCSVAVVASHVLQLHGCSGGFDLPSGPSAQLQTRFPRGGHTGSYYRVLWNFTVDACLHENRRHNYKLKKWSFFPRKALSLATFPDIFGFTSFVKTKLPHLSFCVLQVKDPIKLADHYMLQRKSFFVKDIISALPFSSIALIFTGKPTNPWCVFSHCERLLQPRVKFYFCWKSGARILSKQK